MVDVNSSQQLKNKNFLLLDFFQSLDRSEYSLLRAKCSLTALWIKLFVVVQSVNQEFNLLISYETEFKNNHIQPETGKTRTNTEAPSALVMRYQPQFKIIRHYLHRLTTPVLRFSKYTDIYIEHFKCWLDGGGPQTASMEKESYYTFLYYFISNFCLLELHTRFWVSLNMLKALIMSKCIFYAKSVAGVIMWSREGWGGTHPIVLNSWCSNQESENKGRLVSRVMAALLWQKFLLIFYI